MGAMQAGQNLSAASAGGHIIVASDGAHITIKESPQPPIAGSTPQGGAGSAPALHRIPSAPHTFTGRAQEIDDLLKRIAANGAAAAVVGMQGLQGQGGVGKTALILSLAEKIGAQFPDGQFFLNLHGYSPDRQPLPPTAFLAHVVQSFRPAARASEEVAELQHLYRECLAGKRALLIADNVAPQAGLEGEKALRPDAPRRALPRYGCI